MFCTDMMPSTTNATLEQGERVFNGVGMRVSHDVDSLAVIDRLVFSGWHSRPLDRGRIGWVIICKNHFRIFADVLTNVLSHSFSLNVFGVKQSKLSVTLANSNDNVFLCTAP